MNKGFIGWLVLIIIALALAKYFFDWSIFEAINSEKGRETIAYIQNVLSTSWIYIRDFVILVWQKIVDLWPFN